MTIYFLHLAVLLPSKSIRITLSKTSKRRSAWRMVSGLRGVGQTVESETAKKQWIRHPTHTVNAIHEQEFSRLQSTSLHFSPLLLRGTDRALVQAVRFFGTKPLAVKYSSWMAQNAKSCWILEDSSTVCFRASSGWCLQQDYCLHWNSLAKTAPTRLS